MRLDSKQLEALRGFASSMLIFAGTAEPGKDCAGNLEKNGLTETQVRHALTSLGLFEQVPAPGLTACLVRAYPDVAGEPVPEEEGRRAAVIRRLRDCFLSIPSWDAYAALLTDYGTSRPQPRPGRDDDGSDRQLESDPEILSRLAASAMKHLKHPSRLSYVVSGCSDLSGFHPDEQELLRENLVFVKADLDRFDERGLILAFRDDEELLGKLCACRAKQILQKTRR